MGKRVTASDFLNFPSVVAEATIANSKYQLDGLAVKRLLAPLRQGPDFIEKTFEGIFFTRDDLRFLDRVSANLERLPHRHQRALARAALIRSCLKKQPRGVFTVSGDLSHYDDGRRDLRLSIEEHFLEQVQAFNRVVFDNGHRHFSNRADVFDLTPRGIDLVYLDPPYVPRSDDNCYMKRYHFLEGLSCYWQGVKIMEDTLVRRSKNRILHSAIEKALSMLLTASSGSTATAPVFGKGSLGFKSFIAQLLAQKVSEPFAPEAGIDPLFLSVNRRE